MGSYRIEWKSSTKKDLRRIAPREVSRIVEAITKLSVEPRPLSAIKLQGSDFAYRIRVGNYRVIYEIYDNLITIEIIRVSHRRDVYR